MNEFFGDLNLLQQIFFILAASSTLILVIQTILALIGIGHDDSDLDGAGVDADMDTDVDVDVDIDGDIDIDVGDLDTGAAASAGIDVDAMAAQNIMYSPHTHGFDTHGLRLFTIRGIVAFFMMGSWCGLILSKMGMSAVVSCSGALIAGTASLFFMAKIMQMLMSLQADGTVKVRNALGQIGQVYIRIPAGDSGMGKVNVTVQEQLREFDAVTESSEMIKTGEMVYVTDIRAGNVLVVEKVEK